jgi:hypothetical protein
MPRSRPHRHNRRLTRIGGQFRPMNSDRRFVALVTRPALVAVILGGLFAATFFLQETVLPRAARGANDALRMLTWFEHRHLVASSILIDGRHVHGLCADTWLPIRGRRKARGDLLRLDDGFTLFSSPGRRLVQVGGTRTDRALSPLVELELGGCPRLLSRYLESNAQHRRIFGMKRTFLRGVALVDVTIPIDASRLTLFAEARRYRLVSLAVVARRVGGRSEIRFARMTASVLRALEKDVPTNVLTRAGG